MNAKISISSIMKLVNILFLIILENFVFDCGMGFFGTSILVIGILYTILFGGLQSGISKMISVRNNKGLNSNAQRVLKPAIIYVLAVGGVIVVAGICLAGTFSANVLGSPYLTSMIQICCLILLFSAVTDVLCGYQIGNGNVMVANIVNLLRMVLPLIFIFPIYSSIHRYGEKVSSLLKNSVVTSAYSALGLICVYAVCSAIILIVAIILNIRLRIQHDANKNIRSMDSKRVMYTGILSGSFRIALNQFFPVLSLSTAVIIYLRYVTTHGLDVENAFINIGALFSKLLLPAVFVLCIFAEYIAREKYRLHIDLKKEDHKTATARAQYMIKNSFFMLLPPAMILTFLADPFVKVFFSGQYTLSASNLQIGGFLLLFAGVGHSTNAIVKGLNKELYALGTQLVAFLIQVVFLVTAISKSYGSSMFIIYSFYLFYLIQIILDFVILSRTVSLDLMDMLIKIGKYGASSLVMMILFIILDKFILMNVLLILLSMFLGYLLYYLTLLALKGISKKDEMALKRTLNYYPVSFLKSRLRL